MLSASTARLVDGVAARGEVELVQIKGVDKPVMARGLVAVGAQPAQMGLPGTTLVGREWELTTVASMLDRSISGHGCVVDDGTAGYRQEPSYLRDDRIGAPPRCGGVFDLL
jgi:adenylate cyclase